MVITAFAKDMEKMSKALKDLNKDGGGSRTWSVHVSDTWGQMKSRMSDVAQKITIISERSAQQVQPFLTWPTSKP